MSDTLAHAVEEFAHSPIEVIAALGVIGGIISSGFKAGRLFWINVWARFGSKPMIPTETLRIVQDTHHSWWALGSTAGTPAMQVIFRGHVTDISGRPNRILRVDLPAPPTQALMVTLNDSYDGHRAQEFLRPLQSIGIHVTFFAHPVTAVEGKPWKSSLVFTDQYGNRHRLKNCVFRGLPGPKA